MSQQGWQWQLLSALWGVPGTATSPNFQDIWIYFITALPCQEIQGKPKKSQHSLLLPPHPRNMWELSPPKMCLKHLK